MNQRDNALPAAPLPSTAGSPLDIFSDPAKLALPAGYSMPVEQMLLRLAVDKPHKQSFFRVHPDEQFRLQVLLLEYGDSREKYLVVPGLHQELVGQAQPYTLYFYVTREGTAGLWPVRLPGHDGKTNAWWDTAHAAAKIAMGEWVRMESDMGAGSYKIHVPRKDGVIPDPQWPSLSVPEALRLGFQNRVIDTGDHIVLKKLRGEA